MKSKNKFLLVGIGFMATVLLAGCMDNGQYPKVSELLYIQNGTDSIIYVEYGFSNRAYSYYGNNTDSVPKTGVSIYQFDYSQINGLWMSEKDFNAYMLKIRIYKLNKKDTTFVAPHYYNTKSAWKYDFNNSNSEFGMKVSRNVLIILPTMFNQ